MTVTAERSAAGPTGESSTMTVGEFLPRRIREAGVSHAFGVPGDYNLELLQRLKDTATLEWIGACNELNASYAADGYARLKRDGRADRYERGGRLERDQRGGRLLQRACPGDLHLRSIPYRSMERGLGMHHTMTDGTWDRFINAYAQVTAAQARLTPDNAVTEIDR
jgi:indolepyruvate decarboxylase